MKNNVLRTILCLFVTFCFIFCIIGCNSDTNTDTGSTNSSTNTDTSTDTGTDTSTDTSTDTDTVSPVFYTVTFVLNGEVYQSQRVEGGNAVVPPAPIKAGYYIPAWLLNGEPFDLNTPITSSITLTASWEPSPATIIFNANGGTGEMDSLTTTIKSSITLTKCTFERVGYTFKGWATTSDGGVFYRDKGKLFTGTDTEYNLYAVWEANSYSLTLDHQNPFNTENEALTLKTDETYTLNLEPSREYHKFLGWSRTKGGVVEFELHDTFKMEPSNLTLYAVWEIIAPENTPITLINNGTSEYSIVYTSGNATEQELASLLATHIKEKYGVTLPCYASNEERRDKEIIIGGAREQGYVLAEQIRQANDFIIGVCENDLVLYATSKYLLEYMIDVAKADVFTGKVSAFDKNYAFKYSLSKYKDMTYASYYKDVNGNYTYNSLLNIFKKQTYTASDGTVIPYRIYVPSSYDPNNPPAVLTVLHGAGERGTDNSSQLKNMVHHMMNQNDSKYLNAIIIAPQCPYYNADGTEARWVDWNWGNGNYSTSEIPESNELKAVYELLSGFNNTMPTDTSRYYIMGLSMGGFGTWDMLARHGDMFAAGIALCGGGDPEMASMLKDIPIYIIHSTDDGIVPFKGSKEMFEAIKDAGGNLCEFDEYNNLGHFVWDTVGKSEEIASWLFAQSKK